MGLLTYIPTLGHSIVIECSDDPNVVARVRVPSGIKLPHHPLFGSQKVHLLLTSLMLCTNDICMPYGLES
jgi:hypothetical protein